MRARACGVGAEHRRVAAVADRDGAAADAQAARVGRLLVETVMNTSVKRPPSHSIDQASAAARPGRRAG